MKSLRIMIVDDNSLFTKALSKLIKSSTKHKVVATAEKGIDAIKISKELKPDLIFLDISMPGMDGITTAKKIKEQDNPPKIIICSIYDTEEYRTQADEAGVDDYICKSELSEKLTTTINRLFPTRSKRSIFNIFNKKHIL